MRRTRDVSVLAWVLCLLLPTGTGAITFDEPDVYLVKRTWNGGALGIPTPLGGLLFSPGGDTLYIVGASNETTSALYAVPVSRHEGEVASLGPPALVTPVFSGEATTPGLDAGLSFGPAGSLFYTYWDANVLGERPGGVAGPETRFDLMPLAIPRSLSGLTFSPHVTDPATQFAHLQISAWDIIFLRSTLYDLPLSPALDGTFTPGMPTPLVTLPLQAVGGMQYVPSGPYAGHLMHVEWLEGELHVLVIDPATGLPIDTQTGLPTRGTSQPLQVRIASALGDPWGLVFDPLTGDLFIAGNGDPPADTIVQIGLVTTTTTATTPTTTTTTILLPPACGQDASFTSIVCRLESLIGAVEMAVHRPVARRLVRPLERARARVLTAGQLATDGRRHRAIASLIRARRQLGEFQARLRTPGVLHAVDGALRAEFASVARAARRDLVTIRDMLRLQPSVESRSRVSLIFSQVLH